MPRLARFVIAGQPQHVVQRGNSRQDIYNENGDYHFYLEKLKEAADKRHCDIHAYVLMTDHVHLQVTPHQDTSIAKIMQMLGRYYAVSACAWVQPRHNDKRHIVDFFECTYR